MQKDLSALVEKISTVFSLFSNVCSWTVKGRNKSSERNKAISTIRSVLSTVEKIEVKRERRAELIFEMVILKQRDFAFLLIVTHNDVPRCPSIWSQFCFTDLSRI